MTITVDFPANGFPGPDDTDIGSATLPAAISTILPLALVLALALALTIAALPGPALAQSENETTVTPLGAEMDVKQKTADPVDAAAVIDMMNAMEQAIADVKILYAVKAVEVILIDADTSADTRQEIDKAAEAHGAEIEELRDALQANALTYEALNTQGIDVARIIAARVDEDKTVTIYVRR